MISKEELIKISKARGYPVDVIEKDYALTWALKAIYSHPRLFKYLVFKGGTCLSKVYVENYRLSEDLDFSGYREGKMEPGEIKGELEEALKTANQEGAPNLTLADWHESQNSGYVTSQIRYQGPLSNGRIKLDISLNEYVIYDSKETVSNEKTYRDIMAFKIHCYALIEILLEKFRSTMQRAKSRDYYDLWQIMRDSEFLKDYKDEQGMQKIRRTLKEKCVLSSEKRVRSGQPSIEYSPERLFDEKQLEEISDHWLEGLGALVRKDKLPKFSEVVAELKETFWLEAELAEFSKTLDTERLRDIKRAESMPLIERAIILVYRRLKSEKTSEVVKALYVLSQVTSIIKIAEEKEQLLNQLHKLAQDPDAEISNLAKKRLEEITTGKRFSIA